jgi:hypothetical protein
LKFYVTKLDPISAFVFGHNWLHRYNPSIDWSAGQITHFRQLLQSVLSSSRSGAKGPDWPLLPKPSASVLKPSVSSDTPEFDSFDSSALPSFSNDSSVPSISFVNAAVYARLARLPGNTIFIVTVTY